MRDSPYASRLKCVLHVLMFVLGLLLVSPPEASGQGCVPARFMTLSLSAEGVTHLEGGRWQSTAAYRFLHAEDGYEGDRFDPKYARTIGARINIHSFDVQTTCGFTSRYSMTLTAADPALGSGDGDVLTDQIGVCGQRGSR